ncbi:hypothetical protein D3C83_311000 [compost metagenome]
MPHDIHEYLLHQFLGMFARHAMLEEIGKEAAGIGAIKLGDAVGSWFATLTDVIQAFLVGHIAPRNSRGF